MGFSTHTGGFNLPALVKPFVRTMADGTPDIVVAGGAVHFRAPDDARVTAVVEALQRDPAVGAIFSRDAGRLRGTLSFEGIGWAHPRAAEILVSAAWSEGAGRRPARAVHGVGTGRPRQHEPVRGDQHADRGRARLSPGRRQRD